MSGIFKGLPVQRAEGFPGTEPGARTSNPNLNTETSSPRCVIC